MILTKKPTLAGKAGLIQAAKNIEVVAIMGQAAIIRIPCTRVRDPVVPKVGVAEPLLLVGFIAVVLMYGFWATWYETDVLSLEKAMRGRGKAGGKHLIGQFSTHQRPQHQTS